MDILVILWLYAAKFHVKNFFCCSFKQNIYVRLCLELPPQQNEDQCIPNPCGHNTQCRDGICSCLPEYFGDAYTGCRPECVSNLDCANNKVCTQNKCTNPCPNICAQNALCEVINHIPMCRCPPGMSGNAFVQCQTVQSTYLLSMNNSFYNHYFFTKVPVTQNVCQPSPCGSNSICREINGQAVCACLAGYIDSPPTCRPECVIDSECSQATACLNQKCKDPCPGTCGINAKCTTVNHNPICICLPRYTGDPFLRCQPIGIST